MRLKHLIIFLTLTLCSLAAAQGVGSEAPAFNLVNAQGESVILADFRGQPLILNVWASWCAPCVEELPFFQRLYTEINDAGEDLNILLVNNGENPAEAVAFLQDLEVTLPTALDPTKEQREASKAQDIVLEDTSNLLRNYRVRGMPTTFFIDAEGTIRGVKVGLLLPSEAPALLASIGVNWEP
ncbi:TlpA disulfide reductase family protein [soil metagenome]